MNATASAPEQREGRIARSWRLTKASWQVVREDRVILLLTILSTLVGAIGVAVIFGVAGLGSSGAHGHGHLVDGRVAIVALILAYPLMFVSTFFNAAIAAAAAAGLQGRRLSLGHALAVPASRVGQLAVWALFATIFGVVLEQLARRLPLAGAIVARLVGLAWSIASLFAIPILALEGGSAPHAPNAPQPSSSSTGRHQRQRDRLCVDDRPDDPAAGRLRHRDRRDPPCPCGAHRRVRALGRSVRRPRRAERGRAADLRGGSIPIRGRKRHERTFP